MARPGIMIYFDVHKPLQVLSHEDKGKLFDAILDYGEFGVLPEFEGMLAMAWGFLQPKLDRDGENYNNAVDQRKYAAFCKKLKEQNLPKVSFEDWKDMPDCERERMTTTVNDLQPTTTPAGTTTSAATVSTTVTPITTPTLNTNTITVGKGEGAGGGEAEVQFDDLKKARIAQLMGSK